ncbi:RNA 2',3'-cyclic phosphodiesterase [Brevundimonas sp.]|uniref:RNA 2',3'-cyclic phosphodiesterase n=1 Tax=Brevundimonas sp. TaxID=1871086 RepID=UPI003BABC0DF
MLRLFTALPIPWDVAETLKRRQTGLPGARWRSDEQLHVTLAFYGEVTERQADDLAGELARIPPGVFEITLKGVGAFGDAHRSHTLWAGLEPSERLEVLAGRCKSAAERAGVRMEPRVYRPHLTLAYLKLQTNPDRIGAWIAGHNLLHSPPIRADRFGLYSSTLTGDGSVYALEREYPL